MKQHGLKYFIINRSQNFILPGNQIDNIKQFLSYGGGKNSGGSGGGRSGGGSGHPKERTLAFSCSLKEKIIHGNCAVIT